MRDWLRLWYLIPCLLFFVVWWRNKTLRGMGKFLPTFYATVMLFMAVGYYREHGKELAEFVANYIAPWFLTFLLWYPIVHMIRARIEKYGYSFRKQNRTSELD